MLYPDIQAELIQNQIMKTYAAVQPAMPKLFRWEDGSTSVGTDAALMPANPRLVVVATPVAGPHP